MNFEKVDTMLWQKWIRCGGIGQKRSVSLANRVRGNLDGSHRKGTPIQTYLMFFAEASAFCVLMSKKGVVWSDGSSSPSWDWVVTR
jgi:hypothetical protein